MENNIGERETERKKEKDIIIKGDKGGEEKGSDGDPREDKSKSRRKKLEKLEKKGKTKKGRGRCY